MKVYQTLNRCYLLVFILVVIDQAIKVFIKLRFEEGESISLIGDVFKLHFIENQGAAFGMTFQNIIPALTEEVAKVILSLFSVVAVGAIFIVLKKVRYVPTALPYLIALILGGALGNIIDRLFYGVIFESYNTYEGGFLHGRVVDMFYLDIWQGWVPENVPIWGGSYIALWPIFNWADACISVGIVSIILFQKRLFPETEKKAPVPNPEPASEPAPESGNPSAEN